MRFWVSAPKTSPRVRNLDNIAMEHSGLFLTLAIVGLLILLCSGYLFFVPHAFLMSIFAGFTGTAAVAPEGYHKFRVSTDKLRAVETGGYSGQKPLRVQWYQTLYDIDSLEVNLAEFLANLTTDDYSYSHALNAYNTVKQELWEATYQWRKMGPFLNSPKDSTRKLLEEEYKQILQRHEAVSLIVDSVFNLSLRSASFTRAPKDHLDILVRELEGLCTSMEELDNMSNSYALPSATGNLSFRDSFSPSAKEKVRLEQSA